MPFWKCYYHIIWATKNRAPLITKTHENILFPLVREIAHSLDTQLLAINGMPDHIHVAVSMPPKIAISQWVKQVKGKSSHELNQHITNQDRFRWQSGFGVLTYGQKQLPYVLAYIENQKQHHQDDTTQPYLETIE
ncbi:MAG: IS200/IS605 family transposase [Chloroflexota bacterium]